MTPERWAVAQQLFEAALACPAEARQALVDRDAADPDLAALVHGLLAADAEEHGGTPLVTVVSDAVADATAGAPPPLERLGPYKIVKMLGEGGMGAVYLAERDDDEFLQQVAVKVVRGLLDPERVRQFRAERQILAWLEHPNIARLLDGGTTAEGLPYLVMEHVEGVPIDDHCDAHRLTVAARLRLFLTVCDAVSHAHSSLIVHRDIKPSNIMVTDDGVPKLLDFGIARLALEGAPDSTAQQPGGRMLTPDYASPEVVRGEQVTTAADVYALGVLLYELLTGARPLRFATMTSAEIERVVCHVTPLNASVAARAEGDRAPAPAERARLRSTTTRALRACLEGDLDAVLRMALHKDSSKRYASVEAFAADLRRHLDGAPVVAREATWTYVATRFVARHRLGVGAAVLLVALVAAAAVTFSIQASRLAEQSDRTARERDTAQQVLSFLTGLFEVSDPDRTAGVAVSARELLDRGAERIDSELAGQPVVQARLLGTIGTVYGSLGIYDRSAALLERGLALRRSTLGPEHLDTAESMEELAEAYRELARFEEAERLHRDALALKQRLGAPPAAVASSLNNLGLTLSERGRYAEAEPLLRQAIAMWRTQEGPATDLVATGLDNLASTLRLQGRLDEAVPVLEEAIALRRQRVGNGHPALAQVLGHLGQVLNAKGELEKAEPLLREALAIRTRVYGAEHPDTITALNNLTSLLHDQGDLAAAEPLYRTALASVGKRLGTTHPDYAVQLNNLATLLEDRRRYDEAEDLYRQSLAVRRQRYGARHPAVARVQHSLGRVLLAQGRTNDAEAMVRAALAVRQEMLPEGNYEIALSLEVLGEVMAAEKRPDEAAALLDRALAMQRKSLGPTHPNVADTLIALSALNRARGTPAAAEPLAKEAVAIRAAKLPTGHWKRAMAEVELASVYLALGRRDQAHPLLTSALTLLTAELGDHDPRADQVRALLRTAPRRGSSPPAIRSRDSAGNYRER
ncbi:MAG: serine/threonine-protein kinase [Acidobacteriota bacterium]